MSRELILIKKCDLCQREDDNVDVPATTTYTVGIVEGESRPVPKVLDLCDDHAGPLADLLAVMADIHQLPGDVPKAAKSKSKAPVKVKAPAGDGYGHNERQCPICHSWRDTASLTRHIWRAHRPDGKPPMPTSCPECGEQYGGQGMAAHRRMAHGFDAVADALSGVPGYTPPKAARKPPPGQLELTGT